MAFDYRKLTGRIVEVCGSKQEFAKRLGISRAALSNKMQNHSHFTQEEIIRACKVLDIRDAEAYDYFFARQVNEN